MYERTCRAKGRLFHKNDNNERKLVNPKELEDENFKPLNSITYYMEGLLQLCLEKNIPVYIEQLPIGNPGYQTLKDNGYLSSYKDYLKGLNSKYPGSVINYEIPLYDAQFFRDDSHLNFKGAKKYTKELEEKYPQVFGN